MKAFIVCLSLAFASVLALPEYYGHFQQQWPQQKPQPIQWRPQEPEMPQWGQGQQWQQPMPQPQPEPMQHAQPQESQVFSQYQQNISEDGYKIVPGVVEPRCPRTDDPKNPTHLPIAGDCSKFMKCFGGRAYAQSCPGGLEFGVAVNRCDYPALAKCSNNGW
ncbi:activating signal cointegrator 1 complex subunit 2 homolog [Ochlerotatus camptorhynchus]|uniref:activating signal cointegrator 1 complex subunit 2 homolog n=1 Tax=Ochlerotatus camptorhynchus TaxID=644619 RepID=UPI0031D2DCE7